jgi:hypothetical protein
MAAVGGLMDGLKAARTERIAPIGDWANLAQNGPRQIEHNSF